MQLIEERIDADSALAAAETAAALDEPADVPAARQRAADVMSSIERQGVILGGLRTRLVQGSRELESQRAAVATALPDHVDQVKADFATEWSKGAAAFAELLGKRRALEARIGKLDLPEPQPSAYELTESIAAPWSALAELGAGLEEVANWSRMSVWPEVDSRGPASSRPFDPRAVYVLTCPYDELRAGQAVMEVVFPPGLLYHLVHVGNAACLADRQWNNGLETGRQAAAKIAADEQTAALEKMPRPEGMSPEVLKRGREAGKRQQAPSGDYATPVGQGDSKALREIWGKGPSRPVTGL